MLIILLKERINPRMATYQLLVAYKDEENRFWLRLLKDIALCCWVDREGPTLNSNG